MAGRGESAIEEENSLWICIAQKLKGIEKKCNDSFHDNYYIPCIYRVSDEIRRLNKRAYSPSAVSIGPLHRGKEHLQPIEELKLTYMAYLFGRTPDHDCTLKECVSQMLKMEPYARGCYAEGIKLLDNYKVGVDSAAENYNCNTDKKKFAEMMLMDGCFIIELLIRCKLKFRDPIVGNPFLRHTVENDLLLLENQIPFPILQTLYDVIAREIEIEIDLNPSLPILIISFFEHMMILDKLEPNIVHKTAGGQDFDHILHLFHKIHQPSNPKPNKYPYEFKYSATDLVLSGVKLERSDKRDIFDVEFSRVVGRGCFWKCRSARFKIPPFHIYDNTDLLLRNLIALEHCRRDDIEPYFTSYAKFLDMLISTEKDVEYLEAAQIINNTLGSREDASHLFNNLCKHIAINEEKFYFAEPCNEVSQYCKRYLPKHLAKLKRDYLASPWARLGFAAGILLFLFTLISTIYTIISYDY